MEESELRELYKHLEQKAGIDPREGELVYCHECYWGEYDPKKGMYWCGRLRKWKDALDGNCGMTHGRFKHHFV